MSRSDRTEKRDQGADGGAPSESGNEGKNASKVQEKGVGALQVGAIAAMKGAPPLIKAGIYACLVIAIVSFGSLFVPPYEMTKLLLTLVILGVFLLLFLFLMSKATDLAGRRPGSKGRARVAPMPPSPGYDPVAACAWLENARQVVRDALRTFRPDLPDEQVRANIFLPMTGAGGTVLRIPPDLCINMQNGAERKIEFRPGVGATGIVFQTGEPQVVERITSTKAHGGWDEIYKINRKLAKVIDRDLMWIISMPLKATDGRIIGVYNIDGLKVEFTDKQLKSCKPKAEAFAALISKYIRREHR